MKATKNGEAYNYTGYACYISALGIWHECAADYRRGSALGLFKDGELVSLLRSTCNSAEQRLLLDLKF